MRGAAFTTLLLLLSATTFGAADAQLLGTIVQRQLALRDYAVDMRISVFALGATSSELDFAARSTRRGEVTALEFRNFLVLLHPKMRVVVDRAERTIHLNAANVEAPPAAGFDPTAILEGVSKSGYALATEQDSHEVGLRFTAQDRPGFMLRFDSATLQLKRMEMDAPADAGGGRTVVTYDWHEVDAARAELLTTGYYVRRAKGEWLPAPSFAGYRLVVSRER